MTPAGLARLEALFEEACALPPESRGEFVARACDGDAELQRRLQSMLAADAARTTPLDVPALGGDFSVASTSPVAVIPGFVGRYRIRRLIGEGGMGVVYEAEQENPRRRVALKLLRPGMATPNMLRRFELEAQVLGRLSHPGIAQIFEAGTAESEVNGVLHRQPFLAMEFVEGTPISRYADSAGLTLRQRVALLAGVCDAVHHAHQRGIIHRDLKPGNILVSDGATERRSDGGHHATSPSAASSLRRSVASPKVLDFGIARVVDDMNTLAGNTAAGQLIGTIPYMSPEQIDDISAEIDVRTDVYSLGVVLFEMLCGRLPYLATSSIGLAGRIVREPPPLPSALAPEVRGDIQTILLKAMEKDRTRRYASMAHFAQDLRNYLADRPIEARRASRLYVLRKAVARHRFATALLTTIALTITASAVALGVLYGHAERQRAAADARAEALRRSGYFNTIALAQSALDTANTVALLERLEECPPDLRGWEWHYLRRRSDTSRATILAQQNGIGAAYSPDGLTVATWSTERSIRWWTADTNSPLGEAAIDAMADTGAYAPDGRRLFVGCRDGALYVFDVATCARLAKIPAHESWIARVAASPDGRTVATGGFDGQLRIWDGRNGAALHSIVTRHPALHSLAYAPDGATIATGGSDGRIRVWDVATGAQLAAFEGHRDEVRSLNFTPNGVFLLSCSADNSVRVWRVATEELVRTFDCVTDEPTDVAASPDSRRVAAAVFLAIRIWDIESGEEEPPLLGHRDTIGSVAFSPDGQRLVSGDRAGYLKTWGGHPRDEPRTLRGHRDLVRSVRAAPDGKTIASASRDRTIRVWDASTGRGLHTLRGHQNWAKGVAYLPDGVRIVSCGYDGTLRLWDVHTGAALATATCASKQVRGVATSPDGRWIAAACGDGSVELRAANTLDLRTSLRGHKGLVFSVAFSPDSTRVVSGGRDGAVIVWDVQRGVELRRLTDGQGSAQSVAVSPDGSLIAAGQDDRIVRIWQMDSGRLVHELRGHRALLQSVAFSPDGSRLASGCFGRLIHIWDPVSGKLALVLRGHRGGVPSLNFSPDGRYLVSGSNDTTVRVWDCGMPLMAPPIPMPDLDAPSHQ